MRGFLMKIRINDKELKSGELYSFARMMFVVLKDLADPGALIIYLDFIKFMEFKTNEEVIEAGKALFFLRNAGFIDLLI
jgi:hypothetical protein